MGGIFVKNKRKMMIILLTVVAMAVTGCGSAKAKSAAKMKYLGHASIKLITAENVVIYIDPYAGDDYSEPADIILVTHGHPDHTALGKVKTKEGTTIITHKEAIKDGEYQSFEVAGVKISAVAAYNDKHPKSACVGYILEFDGIKLYHAGDTSKITEMESLAEEHLTYALLPMDDVYNMGPQEAAEAAKVIKAKYNVPIHTGPGGVYSESNVAKFIVDGKLVVKPGETLELKE
jgi:L-ascorbate metabolism protein UlaG (beta-lactamase superfamily)